MRCPRCRSESDAAEVRCTRCGAPLRLLDEPPPARLDRTLDLDRRAHPPTTAARVDLAAPVRVETAPRPERAVELCRAPAWRRALAWAADAGIVGAAAGPLFWLALRPALAASERRGGPTGLVETVGDARLLLPLGAFALLLAAVYATLSHGLAGATVGKRLLGLRVVTEDGTAPSLARHAARSLVALASAGAFGLGFLVALVGRTGRALHDIACGTYVVRAP